MIETHGLNHVSLRVADPERSLRFYEGLFGVTAYVREEDMIQVKGPGAHDILVFERSDAPGRPGGIDHFGFRLIDPTHIERAVEAANEAGAKILRRGEFAPGLPYLYIEDPDGYTIEIWYE